MQRQRSFWTVLDLLGDTTAVETEWRAGMGDDFAHAGPFLVSVGRQSPTYPCPQCGAKMTVEEPSRRSRGAFHDDPDYSCEPVRELTAQDLMEWALHRQALYDALAVALDFEPIPFHEVLRAVHEVGSIRVEGQRHPVYYSARNTGSHVEAARALRSMAAKPFLLLTTSHEPACETFLTTNQCAYIALDDNLVLSSAGRFSASPSARHIVQSFRKAVAPPALPAPATSTVGALLELAQKLDSNPRVKAPNHITVLKRYCLDGHSVRQIAKDSHRPHSTIVNRKKALERAMGGASLDTFRQYGDALASMIETVEDKRAKNIYRKGVLYGDSPDRDSG